MLIQRSRVLLLIVAASCVAVCATLHAEDDKKEGPADGGDVKAILLGMRQHVAAVKSIHYTYQTVQSRTPVDKPATKSSIVGEFAYSQGKIFESSDNTYKPESNILTREAYDGKFMQRLDVDRKELIVATKLRDMPYGLAWLRPLSFVLEPDEAWSADAIANEFSWLELSRKAKLEAPQMVAGHPCEVIAFIRPATVKGGLPEGRSRIYAAKDLAWYPIRYTYETVGSTAQSDVAEFQKMETAAGIAIVPTKYLSEAKNPEGKVISKGETTLKIKSLNEKLDDAKFYLQGNAPGKVLFMEMPLGEEVEFEERRKAALNKLVPNKPDAKESKKAE